MKLVGRSKKRVHKELTTFVCGLQKGSRYGKLWVEERFLNLHSLKYIFFLFNINIRDFNSQFILRIPFAQTSKLCSQIKWQKLYGWGPKFHFEVQQDRNWNRVVSLRKKNVRGRGEVGMCLLVKFKDGVSTFEFVGFKYNCTLLVKLFSRMPLLYTFVCQFKTSTCC